MPALRFCRRLLGDNRGVALIEAVAMFPLLVVVVLGTLDLTRLVIIHQRMDRAAATMADLASRDSTVNEELINQIFEAVRQVADPYELQDDGIAIISGVTGQANGTSRVVWQRTGAGTHAAGSVIGDEGDTANLPPNFTLSRDEGTVAAEIFYEFHPLWVPEMFLPRELYFRAFFRPRRSQAVTMEDDDS